MPKIFKKREHESDPDAEELDIGEVGIGAAQEPALDPLVPVRVLRREPRKDGDLVAVTYHDGTRNRAVVLPAKSVAASPDISISGSVVRQSELDAGLPHGEDWATLIKLNTTPEQIANALYNSSIFTFDDARLRPADAGAALRSVGFDLSALLALEHSSVKEKE